ncbi:MAG: alanine dehydrogenase, partial [Acholeplasmataceae bacterium]|nr:alanine dehydrogenase [Acholeplasmataceae bacterium]
PGAVPRTSTIALNNATLKYGLMIADLGLDMAINKCNALKMGVNVWYGQCTCEGVCEAFNLDYLQM